MPFDQPNPSPDREKVVLGQMLSEAQQAAMQKEFSFLMQIAGMQDELKQKVTRIAELEARIVALETPPDSQ